MPSSYTCEMVMRRRGRIQPGTGQPIRNAILDGSQRIATADIEPEPDSKEPTKVTVTLSIRKEMNMSVKVVSIPVLFLGAMIGQAFAQQPSKEVLKVVENHKGIVENVAQTLWDKSEISLHEKESTAFLQDILVKNGFQITEKGSAGVPTAFIAEFGSGEPKLGIMLEYDALPGLGNKAVPRKEARDDGITAGHGCGHNLIGAGAMGAALALKDLMTANKTTGTLRVYGGAAEETEGAKVYMARAGKFDDLDAMLHWHPSPQTVVANVVSTAQQQIYIEFSGKTAHAGNAPWLGRSALDAAELFLNGVNYMREHVKPTARIHYVIRNGGEAPNIVPDKASVQLIFRDAKRDDVEAGVAWIEDIAKGAALMTQTKSFVVPYYGMYSLLPNTPLAERMHGYLESVGVPEFTAEELKFTKDLQTAAGVEATGLANAVTPLPDGQTVGGSTDVGDISWIVPTMGLSVSSMPLGIGLHTWPATASHGTSIGKKAAFTAAEVLTLTGWDVLNDADFRKNVKADFDKRTEGFVYKSPLPDLIKEPVGLPDVDRKYGSVLELKEAIFNQMGDHQLAPHGVHDHDHPHSH